jgi:hypothetical protein
MNERVISVAGSIDYLSFLDRRSLRFEKGARSVTMVGASILLIVADAPFGEANLLIFTFEGQRLAQLGTTCGSGTIDQILVVNGEIRVVEATPRGDFQARLDREPWSLYRIGEWR